MSMICPNSLTRYTLVSVRDYHIMLNNFNSLFCCGCEITHVDNSEKESPTTEFLNLLGKIDAGIHLTIILQSRKITEDVQFIELFRAEKNAKVNPAYESTIFCSN